MAKDQKSLQKLTVSDGPTTLAALGHQLLSQNPELPDEATPTQKRARVQAIVDGYLESPLVTEDHKDDIRNQQWENNHYELIRAISKLTEQSSRMPSINMLSDETGLSRQTIHKHLKEFYQSGTYQSQLSEYKVLSDGLLAKLYQLAMEGDVRAAKVFLDAINGLSGNNRAGESRSENVNYIQVNNNVKIDQVTFANLPEGVQQQIATLILQGLQSVALSTASSVEADLKEPGPHAGIGKNDSQ